jgi:hypothetical protein
MSSSVVTPIITPKPINSSLKERIVTLLEEYLETLQEEQDEIEHNSFKTYDEIVAEDPLWQEMNSQIEEVKDVLSQLYDRPDDSEDSE